MEITKNDVIVGFRIKTFPKGQRACFISFLKRRGMPNVYLYAKSVFDIVDSGGTITMVADVERHDGGGVLNVEKSDEFSMFEDFLMEAESSNVMEASGFPSKIGCEFLKEPEYRNAHWSSISETEFNFLKEEEEQREKISKEAEAWRETLSEKEKEYVRYFEGSNIARAECAAPCAG